MSDIEHCDRAVMRAKGGRYGCGWVTDLLVAERAPLLARIEALEKALTEVCDEAEALHISEQNEHCTSREEYGPNEIVERARATLRQGT